MKNKKHNFKENRYSDYDFEFDFVKRKHKKNKYKKENNKESKWR